jgi:chemotaxis protein CheX
MPGTLNVRRMMSNAVPHAEMRRHLQSVVQEVFSIMVGESVELTDEETSLGIPNITALVGLTGKFDGAVSVRCEMETARLITARMLGLGRNLPSMLNNAVHDGSTTDAVGEICNMIAGAFKTRVCSESERCLLSIPSVIIGTDYQFRVLAATDRVELNFMLEGLPLWISSERRP